MFDFKSKNPVLYTFILVGVLFIPWLGLTLFNTKGEPREAIVAFSMLQQHNWILPVSLGGDIPYKPPFMAWLIAIVSWLNGGEVTQWTSRFPSAIATVLLACGMARFVHRSPDRRLALPVAVVSVTCIEVWRAASACRVDMVLTACMVMASLSLFRYIHIRRMAGYPWGAVVWMSAAVLTKGPVGMILPCAAAWIYAFITGAGGWRVTLRLALVGLLSLLLPSAWYLAAYQQGGDTFLALALEENFGRMSGSMSYASHENPVWYNFITLAAGLLPYTLLALFAVFTLQWRTLSIRSMFAGSILSWLRAMQPQRLYCLVWAVVVFLFFCFPKSKRSVYLLPMYPAMAYFLVLLAVWLRQHSPRALKAYCGLLDGVISLSILLVLAAGAVMLLRPQLLGSLTAPELRGADALMHTIFGWMAALALLLAALVTLRMLRRDTPGRAFTRSVALTYFTLLALNAVFLPPVLSAKSDLPLARAISAAVPAGVVYQYIDDPMLRYYTVNFYIGDRIRPFDVDNAPDQGVILADDYAIGRWSEQYGDRYCVVGKVLTASQKSCDSRSVPTLWQFRRVSP